MPFADNLAPRALLGIALALAASPASAARWDVVATTAAYTVEVDRASVSASEPSIRVAWGRLRLASETARKAGYAEVRVLNRYDCGKPTFETLKRIHLGARGKVLQEETPREPEFHPLKDGTLGTRIRDAVCPPDSFAQMRDIATAAGRAARAAAPGNGTLPAPQQATLAELRKTAIGAEAAQVETPIGEDGDRLYPAPVKRGGPRSSDR